MTKLKTSITKRLFLYFTALILGSFALILLSNTLLLRPLYYSSIKKTMISAIEKLETIDYTQDEDSLAEVLGAEDAGNSYNIMIMDSAGVILYSTSPEFGLPPRTDNGQNADPADQADKPSDPNGGEAPQQDPGGESGGADKKDGIPKLVRNIATDLYLRDKSGFTDVGNGIYMGTLHEHRTDIDMMVCLKTLDSGLSIFVSQAVEPINQSVQQANVLLLACALLTLLIALAVIFKMSKRFTQPIKDIQNTVGQLAALNFGSKCDVKTGDELQSLGDDVNRLGVELESALDTLKKQNEQLEKDIAAQRQFISNASHELRTPLALIKGYADEMNTGYASSEKQKDFYIEIIAEEASKMSRLLKEMLDLTRMESGRTEIIPEKLSVQEKIMGFLDKYDGFITQNGLRISVESDERHIGVFDAMRFEQVLANYISNAARYGDNRKQVRIRTTADDETIRISVFNTGQHIPAETMENIWNSFYKADAAHTRVNDSYGLGLSVVKAIQTVMGQRFGAENVPEGVEFWFEVKRFRE